MWGSAFLAELSSVIIRASPGNLISRSSETAESSSAYGQSFSQLKSPVLEHKLIPPVTKELLSHVLVVPNLLIKSLTSRSL